VPASQRDCTPPSGFQSPFDNLPCPLCYFVVAPARAVAGLELARIRIEYARANFFAAEISTRDEAAQRRSMPTSR